jgi:hypothetical protein
MALQPPDYALGLEIEYGDYSIDPSYSDEMSSERSSWIEPSAESGSVDGRLKVLGE